VLAFLDHQRRVEGAGQSRVVERDRQEWAASLACALPRRAELDRAGIAFLNDAVVGLLLAALLHTPELHIAALKRERLDFPDIGVAVLLVFEVTNNHDRTPLVIEAATLEASIRRPSWREAL